VIDIDTNLFIDIYPEKSESVSGGYTRVDFDLNIYLFILGVGVVYGNSGLTPEEIQFAWESAFIFHDNYTFSRRTRRAITDDSYY